jgi:hypothetical protein
MVTGHIKGHFAEATEIAADGLAGKGTLASAAKVVVSRLGANGTLTEIATADVDASGAFDLQMPMTVMPMTMNPGEILVLQVKNIANAILGSTVLNGVPAFFKGFLIDVPVDTVTSFKTEILLTIAKGGVPGVQNYLNVINTFVDAELAGDIAVFNAFVLDFNSIFGAFATAAIATEGIVLDLLQAAGLPIDANAITSSQMMALAGVEGTVTTIAGKVVTTSKNFIAQLEELTRNAAAPIDKAIFNALVGSHAMFKSTFKATMAANASTSGQQDPFSFPLVKAGFKLQSDVARDQIHELFTQAGVSADAMAMLATAGATFAAQIEQANDVQALVAAKTAFKQAIFGQDNTMQGCIIQKIITFIVDQVLAAIHDMMAAIAPPSTNLKTALAATNLTAGGIKDAIATFDAGTQNLADKLKNVTTDQNANALAEALKRIEKVVLP